MFHAFVEQSEKMIILSGKYIAKGFITIIHHDTLYEANFIIIFSSEHVSSFIAFILEHLIFYDIQLITLKVIVLLLILSKQ